MITIDGTGANWSRRLAASLAVLASVLLFAGCTDMKGSDLSGTGMGLPGPNEIGGTIWNDANSNGAQEEEEAPIGDVTVNLVSDLNRDGNCSPEEMEQPQATLQTDVEGNYVFSPVQSGDYCLDVETPMSPTSGVNPSAPVTVDSNASTGIQVNMGFTN